MPDLRQAPEPFPRAGGGDAKTPPPSDADIVQQTRKTYSGPLAVGVDLMQFDIGDGVAISVISAARD
jgi:hypothetical protein